MRNALFFAVVLSFAITRPASALSPLCNPCTGLRCDAPDQIRDLLTRGAGAEQHVLFVAAQVALDGSADAQALSRQLPAGATLWLRLAFTTPTPVTEHLQRLSVELDEAARIARSARADTVIQILWHPDGDSASPPPPGETAYLFKRAAVAVAGANADAVVATSPLPHDGTWLRNFYADEMGAYVDLISLPPAPSPRLAATLEILSALDPGKTVAVDSVPLPDPALLAVAQAAENAALGARITLFEAPSGWTPESLAPLELVSRVFSTDLAHDPHAKISGVDRAWAFVHSEDLSQRVVASISDTEHPAEILFADRQLSSPQRLLPGGGEEVVYSRRQDDGLLAPIPAPAPVVVLSVERLSAAELGGFVNQVEVAGDREMPVEEILERLQAFEDDQARRIRHYEADKTMHLRYTSGQGVGSVEVSFEGDFFYRRDSGFDWAWQTLMVNGVRWKGALPKLPLIQPETAATLPFQITFNKEYRYRLRGTDMVGDRDCWVVDFAPAGDGEAGNLFKGTVWIDRELYCRVKTRALQLGLEGDVISNEETVFFTPLHQDGTPAPWQRDSFFIATRTVGQEVQSLLNAALPVERETLLEGIRINAEGFDGRLEQAHASEVTMVRDTDKGMRYLIKGKGGEREVEEEIDFDSWAVVGGVFYDDNQDYPLPLAGVNYFSRNFRGSGRQLNLLFAGIMLNLNYAEPSLLGSKWDAGGRLFGFFIPGEEVLYRDGIEAKSETVERNNARAAFYLGRPLGSFTKLSFTYGLAYENFGRADDTAESFVVPTDTAVQSFGTELEFTRAGYNLGLEAEGFSRSSWDFWGFEDNTEFDPDQQDYLRWKLTAAKAWWLKSYMKFAISLEHLNGDNLDRFSKYDFSSFADSSVGGYQSGLVTASEATGIHLSYGFNMAEALRLELQGDAVWATDEATGLKDEFLAGLSLNGTLMGPWQTLINFDIGVPLAGPADSFTARVAVLKLFK